jgi:polyisoprenoid-binding protein YceI
MRLLPALTAPLCLIAQTQVYRIHPGTGDRFALEVEKTGLMSGRKHLFLFERYQGWLRFDAASPERSSVELLVEAASLACQDTWVKPKEIAKIEKTAREEMLAAEQYPQIRFRSEAVVRKGEEEFEVRGGLTLRGRTEPVTVLVRRLSVQGTHMRFQGSATVRLKDYGLKPPSALLGAIGTKNEMRVEFVVSALREP